MDVRMARACQGIDDRLDRPLHLQMDAAAVHHGPPYAACPYFSRA